MKKLLLLLCIMTISGFASKSFAQTPEERPHFESRSPEQIANRMTEQMNKQLQLTDKQFKKIYKLNLKEIKAKEKSMSKKGPGMNGPHVGMRHRPPMGEGGHSMGMKGERPSMHGPMGEHPMPAHKTPNELLKEAQKKESKLKKILTPEQFSKWKKFTTRPAEMPHN